MMPLKVRFSPSNDRAYIVLNMLAVHRGLVNEKKILHRDISYDNILIYPTHNPKALSDKKLISESPRFIDDILVYKEEKCVIFGYIFVFVC